MGINWGRHRIFIFVGYFFFVIFTYPFIETQVYNLVFYHHAFSCSWGDYQNETYRLIWQIGLAVPFVGLGARLWFSSGKRSWLSLVAIIIALAAGLIIDTVTHEACSIEVYNPGLF